MFREFIYNTADAILPPDELTFETTPENNESSGTEISDDTQPETAAPVETNPPQKDTQPVHNYFPGEESSYNDSSSSKSDEQSSKQKSESAETTKQPEATTAQPTTEPRQSTTAATVQPTTAADVNKKGSDTILWVVLWIAVAVAVAAIASTVVLLVKRSKAKKAAADGINQNNYPNQNGYGQNDYPNQNGYGQNNYPNQNGYNQNNFPNQNDPSQTVSSEDSGYGDRFNNR